MNYLLITDCATLGLKRPTNGETVKLKYFKLYTDIDKLKKYLMGRWFNGEFGRNNKKKVYIDNFFNSINTMETNKLVELTGCSLNDCCCQFYLYKTGNKPEDVGLKLDDYELIHPKN